MLGLLTASKFSGMYGALPVSDCFFMSKAWTCLDTVGLWGIGKVRLKQDMCAALFGVGG